MSISDVSNGGRLFDRSRFRSLKRSSLYRYIAIPRRAYIGAGYVFAGVPEYLKWLISSREETNFTYELSDCNLLYLAHVLAVVADTDVETASRYVDELRNDEELRHYLLAKVRASPFRSVSDDRIAYAKRLGWYALVRLLKPAVVVETGVDKGLGAVVLCAALLRNRNEGFSGRYFGTDIDPAAGWLLQPPYSDVGSILVGDSIESLKKMSETIDLFINDSDHSEAYEAEEYETILPKLGGRAVVLGDNAHVTSKLAEFSLRYDRAFLFFKEEPSRHWYPGAGIGISYVPSRMRNEGSVSV